MFSSLEPDVLPVSARCFATMLVVVLSARSLVARLQIFSAPVLMRDVRDEAPFFEFIQRVCGGARMSGGTCADGACGDVAAGGAAAPAAARPGCGGFGIRNFLTLFLSIEVSKAMDNLARARDAGDAVAAHRFGRMVDVFTHQLDASNPVLTIISDMMQARLSAEARSAAGRGAAGRGAVGRGAAGRGAVGRRAAGHACSPDAAQWCVCVLHSVLRDGSRCGPSRRRRRFHSGWEGRGFIQCGRPAW